MFQKLIIVGNIGKDPEARFTPQGNQVTTFSVAVNRKYSGREGQKVEEVTWFRVQAWNKLGEICKQYLSVGKQVLVEGRLVVDGKTGGPRMWTDPEGNPRAAFEIFAETVRFLGRRTEDGENRNDEAAGTTPAAVQEEIPF